MTTGRRASYLPEDRPWPFPGGESGNVRSPERACPRGPLFLPRGEGWHVQSAVAEAHSVCSAPGVGFSPSPFQACMSSASAQVSRRPGQRPSIRTAGPCARKARRGQLPHHPGSFLFTQTINRHTCKPSQDQTR